MEETTFDKLMRGEKGRVLGHPAWIKSGILVLVIDGKKHRFPANYTSQEKMEQVLVSKGVPCAD